MFEILTKFFRFSGENKKFFIKGIVAAIINSMFMSAQIFAIYYILNDVINDSLSSKTIYFPLIIMLISIVGIVFSKYQSIIQDAKGGFQVCADKRTAIANRLIKMPMGYFNNRSLGEITSTVTSTMESLQDVSPLIVSTVLHGFIQATIICIALMFFDYRIGLIVLLGFLCFLFINLQLRNKGKTLAPRRLKAQIDLENSVLEYLGGIGVVRSFNLALKANQEIDRAIKEAENMNIKCEKSFIPLLTSQTVSLNLFSILIIVLSILFYLSGSIDLSVSLIMIIFAFVIYKELDVAGSMSALLRLIDKSMDKVNEVFEAPEMDIDGKDLYTYSGNIEVKNVSFSYAQRKIIDDISFNLKEKTTTAIVGPSGGGKTTICNLITRFWNVDKGEILLDGKNVKDYSLKSLLSNFSMVFQNVYLFNDTILNNIRFGRVSASMEEVKEAARKACIDDFIESLPDGYDTVIGEGGATISGGEKQRISIARAILKNAPIVILDEATANIDPENENKIQLAIAELTKNKTLIKIAHRLNTVRNADKILVISEGKILEEGNHEQLMKHDGLYKSFIAKRKESIGWKIK